MLFSRLCLLVVVFLVSACSRDGDSDPDAGLPAAALPGVFSGEFPCVDCPAITATLWLRPDERFFFAQRYPADGTAPASVAYSLGRWQRLDDGRAVELAGRGPRRLFTVVDADTLLMQTDSNLEHRLTRDAAAPAFSATVRMAGMMTVRGDRAIFTECLTGLSADTRAGRELARFRHQYRSAVRRGAPVLAELEGRFTWSEDGSPNGLIIHRFITVKPRDAC